MTRHGRISADDYKLYLSNIILAVEYDLKVMYCTYETS